MIENSQKSPKLMKKVGNYLIQIDEELGSGRFGKVFPGNHLNSTNQLAIKQISLKVTPPELEQLKIVIDSEIDHLKPLFSNQHILKIVDKAISLNNFYLITEICNGGNLEQIKGDITTKQSIKIIRQIAKTLAFAHSLKISHQDLRPTNILFHEGEVKISDFGMANLVEMKDTKKKIVSKKGNPLYVAPEIFYNEKVDEKCDVWSLGIIFYELIYKTLPWNGKSAIDLFRNNISKKKISFPKGADDDSETQDLISKMLQTDKNKRISIQEVLEHEALQRKTQKKIIKK